jgi:hypothetical protein
MSKKQESTLRHIERGDRQPTLSSGPGHLRKRGCVQQEVLLGKSFRGCWTPEDQKENQMAQPEPLKKGKEINAVEHAGAAKQGIAGLPSTLAVAPLRLL